MSEEDPLKRVRLRPGSSLVYGQRGIYSHIIDHQMAYGSAICGQAAGWRGTGSMDEIEEAQERPLCPKCREAYPTYRVAYTTHFAEAYLDFYCFADAAVFHDWGVENGTFDPSKTRILQLKVVGYD